MRVLIVEDEVSTARRLKRLINEIEPTFEIVATTESVEDTVNWLKKNQEPDLIFMDIQLSDGVSLEIFNQIKLESAIVFTTAYDEYAIEAFKVNSIDYLLKPINSRQLEKSIEKFHNLREKYKITGSENPTSVNLQKLINQLLDNKKNIRSRFLVKSGVNMQVVNLNEIGLFYIRNHNLYLRTKKGTDFLIDETLDELEKELPGKDFCRISRQMILNLNFISHIKPFFNNRLIIELSIPFSEDIVVSRERVKQFKEWLKGIESDD